jgi:impB/mucB/samB family
MRLRRVAGLPDLGGPGHVLKTGELVGAACHYVKKPHTGWPRIIAHADMYAFYAAIEQLDDPALRGRPILVGPPSSRGVVLTASYEARPYGVGSAMPMAKARRLCPTAVIIPPRFERYQEVSRTIMPVFSDFIPCSNRRHKSDRRPSCKVRSF